MKKIAIFLIAAILAAKCVAVDVGVDLMRVDNEMFLSTVKVEDASSTGTAFLLANVFTNHPELQYVVLVTADHVLSAMASSNMIVNLRVKDGDGYKKLQHQVAIRSNGIKLWTTHPKADVAAMIIPLFPELTNTIHVWNSKINLADDTWLTEWAIHPGDEVRILGYPLGLESNDAGFPVLRSGRISSYPLVPVSTVDKILVDFPVYAGNSGGPVYMAERRSMHEGSLESVSIFRIVGLVDQDTEISQHFVTLYKDSTERTPLGIARVIPAQFIRETIELLKCPD